MIGKISFWIKLPIGYFLIWDTHRYELRGPSLSRTGLSSLSRTGLLFSRPFYLCTALGRWAFYLQSILFKNGVRASHGGSSLSRTGSSPSRTGLFLASLRGAPHGSSLSRTGFELRSTILPLHRSRPLGKFPTTISYRNGVRASHGGSSLSRTGSSPSRTGLSLASLRGAPHGPSLSRTGFELRSTIPWRVLTEPDRLVLSQRNFSVSGFCFYV